jgi:acyl-coenzyme A thioesterase PaaI-like protein
MMKLSDDRFCFACGERNPIGLKLSFDWDGEVLKSSFVPRKEHQGYKDVVHGGIITAVLDECMAQAAIHRFGVMAATVEVRVRFRSALMTDEAVGVEARAEAGRHGVIEGRAEMRRNADGSLVASAEARLMRAHEG